MPSNRQIKEESYIKIYLPKWLHRAFKRYAADIEVPMNRICLDFIWGLLVPDFVEPPKQINLKHIVVEHKDKLDGLGLDFELIARGSKPNIKVLRAIATKLEFDLDEFDELVARSYPGGRRDVS